MMLMQIIRLLKRGCTQLIGRHLVVVALDTPKRTSELNVNQIKVVKLACKNLTRKQKDLISKREDHICKKTHSHGPGTSKGKGVDPRNWGGVAISDSDLDIEAQASMLENFKTNHENEQRTSAQIISPDEDTVVKNPDEDLVKSADESSVSNDEKKRSARSPPRSLKRLINIAAPVCRSPENMRRKLVKQLEGVRKSLPRLNISQGGM
jgi:hypothetical protein